MPQPVKISDAVLLEARITGETMNRSMASQIEYWAQLGRIMESVLTGDQIELLHRSTPPPKLSEILATVGTPAVRARWLAVLDAKPFLQLRQSQHDRHFFPPHRQRWQTHFRARYPSVSLWSSTNHQSDPRRSSP